jgi:MSHA biogenesis protein MshI
MKGSSLFRRRKKTATTVSVMLLPDQILLAIAGDSTDLVRQHIPLGETWPQVLGELFRVKKLLHSKVRVVLDSSQYQQLSIERPEVPTEELAGALPWAIKDFTTEPVTQLAVDYYDSVTNPQARPRLQVVCTPKSRIEEWLKVLQPLAELESVLIDELALASLFGDTPKVEVLLYQLADRDLLLLAVYKGQLCFSRVLRGFMPLVQLPSAQWPAALLDNLILEMQRSFDYLASQLKLPDVASVNVAINTVGSADQLLLDLSKYFDVPTQWMDMAAKESSMEFLPLYGALLENPSV